MWETNFFASPTQLALGAITGLVFGFLLQKAHLTRANTIIGQFLLRDFTVLKVMLTAMIVGGIGIYGMLQLGLIEGLHVKGGAVLMIAGGGVIFGVGMAILGYCPGTGVAALGDGSRDAIPGVLGMLVGAAVYAESHAWLSGTVGKVAVLGKETFVTVTDASPWWFLALLTLAASGGFAALEAWERRRSAGPKAPEGRVRLA